MIRTQIYLTEPERSKLKILSEQNGMTISEIIRRAIDAYLKSETKLAKEDS